MNQHLIKQIQQLNREVGLLKEMGEQSPIEARLAQMAEDILQQGKHINSIMTAMQAANIQIPTEVPQPADTTPASTGDTTVMGTGDTTVLPPRQMPPIQYPQPNVPGKEYL